jgi:hypothetical protein
MNKAAFAITIFACALSGQQIFSNAASSTFADGTIQMVLSNFRGLPVVTGAPYSADTMVEHNGANQAGESRTTQRVWRDAVGRVRIERPLLERREGSPKLIQIFDPVARVGYILDLQNKVAHRVPLQPAIENSPEPARASVSVGSTGVTVTTREIHPGQPQHATEPLGTKTVEGVAAEGTRTMTTWPAGSRGNDRPVVETSEVWNSEDLKTTVLMKLSSPTDGETSVKLVNIRRTAPDESLFRPPADYKVVDDQNSVTLTFKRME